jgi:hypothetical protein
MIRVFLDEWRCGRQFSLRRAVPVGAGILVLGLAMLNLPPALVFQALTVGFLVLGLVSGTRIWNGEPGWDWKKVCETAPAGYAAGKVLGGLAVALGTLAVLSPVLTYLLLQWNLPWDLVALALVWALAAGAVAQALGHACTWGTGAVGRILGTVLVLAWVGLTFQSPDLWPWNPLWEVGEVFGDGTAASAPVLGTLVGAAAVVWGALVLVWRVKGSRP